jgi:Raf kinase inhibitor-like YbhB/YbcL family protein
MLPRETVYGGCGGENQSPQLTWHDAPPATRSFACTCFDPDAPTGSGFWHWLAWDIPATTTSLALGAATGERPTVGKTGYNDFGERGYCGPCPPQGDKPHRYVFTVYALDVPSLEGLGAGTTAVTSVSSAEASRESVMIACRPHASDSAPTTSSATARTAVVTDSDRLLVAALTWNVRANSGISGCRQ